VSASLRGGLGGLAAALAGRLVDAGVRLAAGRAARELARTPDGWRLVAGDTRHPEVLTADAVVLALPAAPAARLLRPLLAAAAAELAAIDYASLAIVTLAFPAGRGPAAAGSGFLVPAVEGRLIKAATFLSAKWPGRPGGPVIVRCSIGRYGEVTALQRDDDELARTATAELARAVRCPAPPIAVRVTRWGGALPQYFVGHPQRVARIRAAVAGQPGLAVCGAANDGVGIPACIRSARAAANAALAGGPVPGR
jgi:oxygen-dependent protoporphyrinogen oxidase